MWLVFVAHVAYLLENAALEDLILFKYYMLMNWLINFYVTITIIIMFKCFTLKADVYLTLKIICIFFLFY